MAGRPGRALRQAEHDLRISDKARAIVVETRQGARSKTTCKKGPAELVHTVDFATEVRWLDETGARGLGPVRHRRTFLQYQKLEDGRIQDPGLDGVCVLIKKKGVEASAEVQAPRQILKRHLDKQCVLADAVGLWVELPAKVEVGRSFPFPGQFLLATLLDLSGEFEGFKSELTLDRVDSEARRAHLSGTASFVVPFEDGWMAYGVHYSGPVTAEVDLGSHTLARASFKGTASVNGRGKASGKIKGEIAFETSATATPVTDVAAYQVKTPVFRDNTYLLGGARFSLPSCWMALPQQERGKKAFIDSRTEDGPAIEIVRSDDPADPSDDAFMEGFIESVRRETPDIKARKVTFLTGDGISFECTTDTHEKVRGFVAPLGVGLIRVRVVGSAAAIKKADAVLKAIQGTLAEADE